MWDFEHSSDVQWFSSMEMSWEYNKDIMENQEDDIEKIGNHLLMEI